MKKSRLGLVMVLVIGLLISGSLITEARGPRNGVHEPEDIVDDYQEYELSEEQIEDLKFMYEEEKLARDLYKKLGAEWDLQIFENISQSEEKHMAALEALFAKYDLEKPSAEAGEYDNSELAEAYDEFLEQGLESEEAALELGKELEEKDIEDLEDAMDDATPDFETVYNNLKEGSENHLESFERALEDNNDRGKQNGQGRGGNGKGRSW
ncbi:MAG: DUF2202 domain-containing protein [Halanaerobacter sp.]